MLTKRSAGVYGSRRRGPGACSSSAWALYVLAPIFGRIELVAFSFILALFLTAVLHPLERSCGGAARPEIALGRARPVVGIARWSASAGSWAGRSPRTRRTRRPGLRVRRQARHWLHTGPLHLKSSDMDKISRQHHQHDQVAPGCADQRRDRDRAHGRRSLGALLLILLSTFFLLRDGDAIGRWALRLFPRRRRNGGPGRAGGLADVRRLHARAAADRACSTAFP